MLAYAISQVAFIEQSFPNISTTGLGANVAKFDGDQPNLARPQPKGFGNFCFYARHCDQLCCCGREYPHCNNDGLLPQEDEARHLQPSRCLWLCLRLLHPDRRGGVRLPEPRSLQGGSLHSSCHWRQSLQCLRSHSFWILRWALLSNSRGNYW